MDETLYSISKTRMTEIADETRRITGLVNSMSPSNIVRALANYAGGGGNRVGNIYTLDLTSIFTINSSSTNNFSIDIPNLDGKAILGADKVIIQYYDELYPGEVMTAEVTSWQVDPSLEGNGLEARLYAAFNGDNGKIGGFRLRVIKSGSSYQGNINYQPNIGSNEQIITSEGYTEIKGLRKPTAIDFSGDLCTVTLDGGKTRLIQFNRDSSGNINGMTIDNSHTIEITGGLNDG